MFDSWGFHHTPIEAEGIGMKSAAPAEPRTDYNNNIFKQLTVPPEKGKTPLELYIEEIIDRSLTESQQVIIRALIRSDG